jgi:hypothetical protein
MGFLKRLPRPSPSLLCIGGVGGVGIVFAVAYCEYRAKIRFAGTENYAISYSRSLDGWKNLPITPQALFAFEKPRKDFILRGSVSQVVAELNPTPDIDTNAIAQFYIDRTHENMPTWSAERVNDLQGHNERFSVIERQSKAHTVITAFAVKGNTTLMISISTKSEDKKVAQEAMGELGKYLRTVTLTQQDMGGGSKAFAQAVADAAAVQ